MRFRLYVGGQHIHISTSYMSNKLAWEAPVQHRAGDFCCWVWQLDVLRMLTDATGGGAYGASAGVGSAVTTLEVRYCTTNEHAYAACNSLQYCTQKTAVFNSGVCMTLCKYHDDENLESMSPGAHATGH